MKKIIIKYIGIISWFKNLKSKKKKLDITNFTGFQMEK